MIRARRLLPLAAGGAVLAAAAAAALAADPQSTIDTPTFLAAARTLLSGHWARTFADPGLQAGPLQIGGIGLAGRVGGALGVDPLRGVAVLQAVVLTAAVLTAVRLLAGPRRAWAAVAAGALALATATISNAYFYGHPAEVLVPVLWVAAARAAQERRPLAAGALVGLSAGFETWGVLGVAVLLLDRRLRARAAGVAAAAAAVLVLYLPFVLAGSFAMFDYRWVVAPGTLPALLGLGPSFGWPLRLAQGAAALAAGAAAARLAGTRRAACWLVPLAVVCVRVALDPMRGAWYLLAPETLALVGGAHLAAVALRSDRRTQKRAAGRLAAALAETLKPTPPHADS
jgi:hypothetical protein